MLCLTDGHFLKALAFQHIAVLLLTHCCGGRSQVVGSPPPVVTLVGGEIMLPCHLDPAADALSMAVEWARPDLEPRFVHLWHEGQNLLVNQNPSYKGRTSLSTDRLKQGDLSLKLSKVKLSDGGTYRCFIPKLSRESTVHLTVGSVSSPVITGINMSSSVGALHCESKGWYPQPEVLWLDAEGNLLPAGPTETVRSPDGLYTVSSRVTVEKRHNNTFTCRVHQKNINQTRETHIQITGLIISGECPVASSSSAARISIILAAVIMFALAVVVCMWRQIKTKINKSHVDETEQTVQTEQLMADSENEAHLEKKQTEVNEQREKKQDSAALINALEEQKKELEALRDQFMDQKEDVEREKSETDMKLQSVDKETEHERAKGYWTLKEMLMQAKSKAEQRKQGLEQLITDTEKLMNTTEHLLQEIKKDEEQSVGNQTEGNKQS